jgi:hypothetical protein
MVIPGVAFFISRGAAAASRRVVAAVASLKKSRRDMDR